MAWAAQRSGLYYTALNRHLRSAEVQYILDDCGATALVTTPAMADVVSHLDLSRVTVRLSVGGAARGFRVSTGTAVAAFAPTPLPDESEGREMLYSSGTTGRPKVSARSSRTPRWGDAAAAPVQIALGLGRGAGADSVYLSPAPLYHSAPLVYSMSMLRLGANGRGHGALRPGAMPRAHRAAPSHPRQFVPTMFVRMLRLPEAERGRYDISSLRSVVHAAAPCPVAVKRQMIEWWGPIINEYYAGTEDIGSTWITATEWLSHPGSVGRPLSPATWWPCGRGAGPRARRRRVLRGRTTVRIPQRASATSMVNARGWRTLGDIGMLDEDGYLYLTDRAAHMIIAGGVNIYPPGSRERARRRPAGRGRGGHRRADPEMGEAGERALCSWSTLNGRSPDGRAS